jgi:hypothetical protein
MLRYVVVLQVTVLTTVVASAPVAQPATSHKMSTVDAIKACRAELGKHGKYLQVRKCVIRKMSIGGQRSALGQPAARQRPAKGHGD